MQSSKLRLRIISRLLFGMVRKNIVSSRRRTHFRRNLQPVELLGVTDVIAGKWKDEIKMAPVAEAHQYVLHGRAGAFVRLQEKYVRPLFRMRWLYNLADAP